MANLFFLFLRVIPICIIRVVGKSMQPTLMHNQRVIVLNTLFTHLHKGDVVVFSPPRTNQIFIKRIRKINQEIFFLEGDNRLVSIDSRQFGWISKNKILGKVIYPRMEYNS